MNRAERKHLHALATEVDGWAAGARDALAGDESLTRTANDAWLFLTRRTVEVTQHGATLWRALPLVAADGAALSDIALRHNVSRIQEPEREQLGKFTSDAAHAVRATRRLISSSRLFARREVRQEGERASRFLTDVHRWGMTNQLPERIGRLRAAATTPKHPVPVNAVLEDWVGLKPHLLGDGSSIALIDAREVAELPTATAAIVHAVRHERQLVADVRRACEAVRSSETWQVLGGMPVDRLKEATRERVRVNSLNAAGVTTVAQVLAHERDLERLPGIGSTTALHIRGAAHTLRQTAYDEMPVRIDIQKRSDEATRLLSALAAWDAARAVKGATEYLEMALTLAPLATSLEQVDAQWLVVIGGSQDHESFVRSVKELTELGRRLGPTSAQQGQNASGLWNDFLARPADYYAMLSELGLMPENQEDIYGDLPSKIVDAVRAFELDTSSLSASLRGYQSFGARFALVQRKVIIGDEMGLGKTIEALAVLTHLHAKGFRHALVICPAAVVTNWVREVRSKSKLRAYRVHGPDREYAARLWRRDGGVAITTFGMLSWLERDVLEMPEVACVVVDEAQYIKNPAAKRSSRSSSLVAHANRAILLTGTPLENRLDEFQTLVQYVRPDLTVDANDWSPRKFRKQVAPAYLRRNQESVLTELPELVEVEEWLPLQGRDLHAYRAAVADGNFMAMRQAATLHGPDSAKIERLLSLVHEAESNGRRVIVFSYFLSVLNQVRVALGDRVIGPLTGSVPATARQEMVDQFSQAGHGAVLVAQILAGGVGLNVQAASVVIICEPQLKPTTEWQAIARSRRMGQLQSVQVHRLLSEEGVDVRVREILAAKTALFEEFARKSEMADSAPEAFDVSEAELARQVVAEERQRLFTSPRDKSRSASG